MCCPHGDLPGRMPALEMSPNVSESLRLSGTTELALCEPERVTSESSFGKMCRHSAKHALHYADEGTVNLKKSETHFKISVCYGMFYTNIILQGKKHTF